MAAHRRGPWSQSEDAYLTQLVHTQGALNWVRIAQLIGSRSPKQCRERYHQNLKPSLNHDPITPEEGLQIERLVAEMGKRWAEIARRLHGRSDNAVKNWWNGSMNRRRRQVVRRRASASRYANDFNEGAALRLPANPAQRPLTITSNFTSSRRQIDPSLPSPCASDGSRADSLDGAPSLISDSGSTFSISPRVAPSPTIELPPLAGLGGTESRRSSLPMLAFGASGFVSESEAQPHALAHRHGESKSLVSTSLPMPLFRRPEQPAQDPRPTYHHHETRVPLLTTPLPSLRLPPLSSSHPLPERGMERDSRMHLSSLLD